MPAYDYDLIVIGAGAAGLAAAHCARDLGVSVAIIDHERLGSDSFFADSLHIDELVKAALIAHAIKSAKNVGINVDTNFDTSQVMAHVRTAVKAMYVGEFEEIKKRGIELLQGFPIFLDSGHIEFDRQPSPRLLPTGKKLRYKKVIIATGSTPGVPNIQGIDSVAFLTIHTLFDLDILPKSMIILGGETVAIQLARALNRLGVVVTLVGQISSHELTTLAGEGVVIKSDLRLMQIMPHEHGIEVVAANNESKTARFTAQHLLVAAGRNPNVYKLGLENAGVHFDHDGIKVDAYLRTSNKHIFACGDVVYPSYSDTIAEHQAVIAARNACGNFWWKEKFVL